MKKFVSVVAAVSFMVAATSPAHAGGLFGNGGLIRGSVGEFLDRTVENPITTPLAQGTAVAAGTAVGEYYGGPVGGMVGACVGQGVNERFAGRRFSCAQQMPSPPPPRFQLGNRCATQMGISDPGPAAPLGSPCNVMTNYGPAWGQVVF